MVLYPMVATVDVAGPLDAFALANFLSCKPLYAPTTVSADGGAVPVAGDFLRLQPTCGWADLPERIDTVLVAGGPGSSGAAGDSDLLAWLIKVEPRCTRMGAICTGSTVLSATGLMKERVVATHWHEARRLKQEGDEIRSDIDADATFINSGKFWTSAGMLAGIDMALAMIESDQGRQLTLEIARFLVMPQRRNGGQSQFSAHLAAEFSDDARVRRVQRHVLENPEKSLSLSLLTRLAGMSERSLRRRFKDITGSTIFRYIEDVRLAHARDLLERTEQSIEAVARTSGFGTATTLRRTFNRRLGVTPSAYRNEPDQNLSSTSRRGEISQDVLGS